MERAPAWRGCLAIIVSVGARQRDSTTHNNTLFKNLINIKTQKSKTQGAVPKTALCIRVSVKTHPFENKVIKAYKLIMMENILTMPKQVYVVNSTHAYMPHLCKIAAPTITDPRNSINEPTADIIVFGLRESENASINENLTNKMKRKTPAPALQPTRGFLWVLGQRPSYYIFLIISWPNSLVLRRVAPSIWRSKS